MNLIKKSILIFSLSNYGIRNISFDKQCFEDAFGNLILYSIEGDKVVIHTGSVDSANEDFDTFIGDLCYCIYNSYTQGFYEPTYYIKRKQEINNGKKRIERRNRNFKQLSLRH